MSLITGATIVRKGISTATVSRHHICGEVRRSKERAKDGRSIVFEVFRSSP